MPTVPMHRHDARKKEGGSAYTHGRTLEADLRRAVACEVSFDAQQRALYATDASNYRQVPLGLVLPRSTDDVLATLEVCRRHGAPILARGGGTSLGGQCCNTAVVMDMSRHLNRILALDPRRHEARVQPGVVLDALRDAAERHHLTYAPDPATHTHNTLGGMIGNNSCGVHSVMGGKTVENVIELDVVTAGGLRLKVGATDAEKLGRIRARGGPEAGIYEAMLRLRDRNAEGIRNRYPDIPRRVSGYNLDQLLPEHGFHVARALVGSEGTLVTVLEATVKLTRSPPARSLLVLGYDDVYAAGDDVTEVLSHRPLALEGIDDRLIDYMKRAHLHPRNVELLPDGRGWLLAEFGGDDDGEAQEAARRCMEALRRRGRPPHMRHFDDPEQAKMIWKVRESGLGATSHQPDQPLAWPGWEDAAVPPDRVGDYLRDFRALLSRHGYACSLYGHFGQGCIHTRIDFDLMSERGIQKYRGFIDEAADLVLRYNGSFSGEHGDGQARAALLPKMYGPELMEAFREFKSIWDPEGRMNPGKVIDPSGPAENLRLGAGYVPARPQTHFRYPEDGGSFGRAVLRCVGVGNCRQLGQQTMCPSYQATREEKHSTRGRARLLFEMLEGDVLKRGWREDAVKDALALCLSCKGCKGDCPVHVDMATYKAEFLSHYYKGRPRPRTAYAFGLIDLWSAIASRAPGLANLVTQTPGLRALAKTAAGIAPARRIPAFAAETFQHWWHRAGNPVGGGERVLLWPDTFNNHFLPDTACAAADVLGAGGFSVQVPKGHVCCGRPLYEFGMLDLARARLEKILERFAPQIDAGIPIVVLEPACASVFRDELKNLLPEHPRAKKLAEQTYFFGEFVDRHADRFDLRLERDAVVHRHCNEKALLPERAGAKVLERMGVTARFLDSGCCGMAGSFGFERDKYDVSLAIAGDRLLPAIQDCNENALLIADGYSCREQIAQTSARQAMHLAQVMQIALRPELVSMNAPIEQRITEHRRRQLAGLRGRTLLTLGGIALGAALWHFTRDRH